MSRCLPIVVTAGLAALATGCATVPRAAHDGDLSAVQAQLAAGVSVDARYDEGGCQRCTLLHQAADGGRLEVVRWLLDQGASPNAVAGHGLTPLHFAMATQSPALTRLLLEHGAGKTIEARDEWGNTALLRAVGTPGPRGEPSDEVLEALLAAGADVNGPSAKGNTPLHVAAYRGFTGTVRFLLAKGADPSRRNGAGETPEALASKFGKVETVAVLRQAR
jgi:ankyrin repeat protein